MASASTNRERRNPVIDGLLSFFDLVGPVPRREFRRRQHDGFADDREHLANDIAALRNDFDAARRTLDDEDQDR